MVYADDLKNCLETLRNGGIILYPTDTIWGLGCDATNQAAVDKIFKIKSRSSVKSLIILTDSDNMTERYVREIPEICYELTAVTDSPLTIIYPQGKNLADGVCSEDGSVAIRICNEEFCSELIGRFRKPVVSTSANYSGQPSPQTFGEIDKQLINEVDYVVKYRQDDTVRYTSSPIIKVNPDGSIRIIRK